MRPRRLAAGTMCSCPSRNTRRPTNAREGPPQGTKLEPVVRARRNALFVPRGTCGIEKHPRVEGNHTHNAPAPYPVHRRTHQLHPPAASRHYTQTMASNSAKVAPGADEGPYAYVKGEGFTTMMLHHGHKVDTDNRARAPPIFQSTSFEFKDAAHGGALFELSQLGPIYTRLMNPTTHVLEYKIAKLEGAPCKAHGDFGKSGGEESRSGSGRTPHDRNPWPREFVAVAVAGRLCPPRPPHPTPLPPPLTPAPQTTPPPCPTPSPSRPASRPRCTPS